MKKIITMCVIIYAVRGMTMDVPIDDFSIAAYSQDANDYVLPTSDNYSISLLSSNYQNTQLEQFYNHYYSSNDNGLSPWSQPFITAVIPLLETIESKLLDNFNNQNNAYENKHYAENFKEQNQGWWCKLREKMNFPSLSSSRFNEYNKAIAVTNTYARALPDSAPDFFHASIAGQGFPFDNLQESAIWAGTPLYVFSVSSDKAWSLVLTPDSYFAWVRSSDIAYTTPLFINRWQRAAQHHLIAITKTETSIVNAKQQFQFTGYIGAVFPFINTDNQQTTILIPVKNSQGQAVIKRGFINTNSVSLMPLKASPQNIVSIINELKNRPYGWGDAFFFNDCSQEMKSLFTPFGIWLPKNSAQQSKRGLTVDLSKHTIDERIGLLQKNGHPLMTLIYINGHIMLYVGNKDIKNNNEAIITYQNVWGLSPEDGSIRYVIGRSLFLPLLKSYPENPNIRSLASTTNFKLIYLDKLALKVESPHEFANRLLEH
jgi:cell wall-associated NlpC family hydrolase